MRVWRNRNRVSERSQAVAPGPPPTSPVDRGPEGCSLGARGLTLVEVVVAIALATLSFGGVVCGYMLTSDSAQWSAYSLAAQSLARQGVERARAAKWDPKAWPPVDELGITNYTEVDTLDVPVSGQVAQATNSISVTVFSQDPPLRQLRADCVWWLSNGQRSRGPFTNTVVTLRTTDQ